MLSASCRVIHSYMCTHVVASMNVHIDTGGVGIQANKIRGRGKEIWHLIVNFTPF